MIADAELGGWGLIWEGYAVLLALFQTLQSATVQWSYTDITHACVDNMNKTDVIKIGPAPSPPFLSADILLSEETRNARTANDDILLLLHSLLPPLLLSDCLFVSPPFTQSPLHSLGPQGCEA